MMWLLNDVTRAEMQAAAAAGRLPTVEQQAEFEALDRSQGILTVAGSSATIEVSGVLTQSPSFFAMLFGGGNTTYPGIVAALAAAEADPDVKEITLAIDSPGGQFAGLFDTLDALQAVSKPLRATIFGMGASAAYAIASQAGEITAANRATMVGSIGVAVSMYVSSHVVDITSTEAPNKRPDVSTESGRAVVREQLDSLHEIFVDAIAEGRNIKSSDVNANFGRGSTLLAGEALSRGMIDAVKGGAKKTVADGGDDQTEALTMNLETLKAEHPGVYAEAVKVGTSQERDRATGHAIMGEKTGATAIAFAAIKDGKDMNAEMTAEYVTAGMNLGDVNARQDDDKEAAAGDGVAAPEAKVDPEAEVVALVESKFGLEA